MGDSGDLSSFGGLLRHRRLAAGLTQDALSERSGIAKRTLQELERGSARPRRDTVRRLIAVLAPPPAVQAQFEAATLAPRTRGRPGARDGVDEPVAAVPPVQPDRLTSFIGRERELDEIQGLLETSRLLTLTGAGGCGKTRLALELTDRLAPTYPDGVFVVSLAAIADPGLMTSSVARVLAIQEVAGEPLATTLARRIGRSSMLLLLDNFEHVVEAAPLLRELLAACPHLTALVTSREVLRLRGEQAYPVPTLTMPRLDGPPADERDTVAGVLASEAGRLFVDRARSAQPAFQLDTANAPAVAEICRRLDGLPLALELAAARVRYLTPASLLARLEHRLQILTGGARDVPARQQTLRATIGWSYDLLSEAERRHFRRLGVFVGGWTLRAAEAIAGDRSNEGDGSWVVGDGGDAPSTPSPNTHHPPPDTLDLVGSLVEKSLLRPMELSEHEPRFTMLETIREYALEQLEASGELATLRSRHAGYFLALAEEAGPHLHSAEARSWHDRLEAEHDNLRAALAWSLEGDDRTDVLVRLAGALWQFWWMRGYFAEGRRWLDRALAATADPAQRATMLWGAGQIAFFQDDNAQAGERWSELLSIGRATCNQFMTIQGLGRLSYLASRLGDQERALALADEGLALARQSGHKDGLRDALHSRALVAVGLREHRLAEALWQENLPLSRATGPRYAMHTLHWLSRMASERGDQATATALGEQSVELARLIGDTFGRAGALGSMMLAARRQADHGRAATIARERLALNRAQGNRSAVVNDLECLAWVARARGESARAARLLGLIRALRDEMPRHGSHIDRAEHDREVEAARELLGEAAFMAAWTEGQAMTVEEGIAYALEGAAPT